MFIVANFLERKAKSLLASTFSFVFLLTRQYEDTSRPYYRIELIVFCCFIPTPGIPGILSEASPIIPK